MNSHQRRIKRRKKERFSAFMRKLMRASFERRFKDECIVCGRAPHVGACISHLTQMPVDSKQILWHIPVGRP